MQLKDDWNYSNAETAQTLPARYFFDPGIFALEKERIFMKSWHVMCHKSELKQPGDFVVCNILDQSVVGTKGADDKIYAFHNVCQHRGNRLVNERRGKSKTLFRCSYHSWCFGLDGSLRTAPRSERLVGFDKESFSCPEVRVEEFAGFLFINLDPEARPIRETLPGAEAAMLERFPDIDDLEFVSEKEFTVPANWKVVMDNNIEGYHFQLSGPVHRVLSSVIRFDEFKPITYENWWTYNSPANTDADEAYGVLLSPEMKKINPYFFNILLFPNITFYRFPFSEFLGTFIMFPTTAETSIVHAGYYASGARLSPVTEAAINWFNEELGPEDISLNVTMQKGIRSIGFRQGRYMVDPARSNISEHLIHYFHSLVYKALNRI